MTFYWPRRSTPWVLGLKWQFTQAGDWEAYVDQPRPEEDFRMNLSPVLAAFVVGDARSFASDAEPDHADAMRPSPNQSPQRTRMRSASFRELSFHFVSGVFGASAPLISTLAKIFLCHKTNPPPRPPRVRTSRRRRRWRMRSYSLGKTASYVIGSLRRAIVRTKSHRKTRETLLTLLVFFIGLCRVPGVADLDR